MPSSPMTAGHRRAIATPTPSIWRTPIRPTQRRTRWPRLVPGDPRDEPEGGLRARPVLWQQVGPAPAKHRAQSQGGDDRVIQLSGHWDEVGDQVERHREIDDQGDERQLAPPWDALVGEQAAE